MMEMYCPECISEIKNFMKKAGETDEGSGRE